MHTMLSTTLPPAIGILVVSGFAAFVGISVLANKRSFRKMSGWDAITRRFPMTGLHDVGNTYKNESGCFGTLNTRNLTIRLADEGLCVIPWFARRAPCLIPWSAIRRVSVSDLSLLVLVDYEPLLELCVPAEAMPAVHAKLPSDLFHPAGSPFEVAKAAIKEGAQPRWMSVIVGRTIQSVEKQIEKKRESREENHNDVV